MTVTLNPKHEIATDDDDNGTGCTNNKVSECFLFYFTALELMKVISSSRNYIRCLTVNYIKIHAAFFPTEFHLLKKIYIHRKKKWN